MGQWQAASRPGTGPDALLIAEESGQLARRETFSLFLSSSIEEEEEEKDDTAAECCLVEEKEEADTADLTVC